MPINSLSNKEVLSFQYYNWKHETSDRHIDASTIKIYWGHTNYYSQDQWLLKAYDLDKEDTRTFALRHILKFY
jgi:predicted DNA-binding transcriptional regulator YafY